MGDATKADTQETIVNSESLKPTGCDSTIIEKEIKTTSVDKTTPSIANDCKVKDSYLVIKEEPEYTNSYIFSVNGAPSRRIRRPIVSENQETVQKNEKSRPQSNYRNPLTGTGVSSTDEISYRPKGRISARHVSISPDRPQSNLELKRPSSSFRNPLTGTGLSSIDEINVTKSNLSKVSDGNPLLGVGYDSKRVITDPVPSDRIHPAGYVRKGIAQSPNNHRIPPGGYSTKLW